eukprot:1156667-Pelagomonas_calceolata.AAC.1
MRRNEEVRSSTTPARQLHELNVQNCHSHLIEIKCCEDTRPGAQLEASQQQHSELYKQLKVPRSLSIQSSWVWVGLSILPIPWIRSVLTAYVFFLFLQPPANFKPRHFLRAKLAGLHGAITPAPTSFASELRGSLLAGLKKRKKRETTQADLATAVPEAKWKRSVGSPPLPSDKQQTSRKPTYPHISNQEELFVPNQSGPTLMLKVPAGGHGGTRMVAVISRKPNKKLEQVFYALSLTAKIMSGLTVPVLELPTPHSS